MAHWATRKIVVRDFFISFKPMGSDPDGRSIDLSSPITNQASDEAIYVAVTGRPAGLWSFIREQIGLSRRFEFVMSTSQCIQRLGSPTTQILSSSRMEGLNTITVGVLRPLKQALLLAALSLFLVISASHKPDLGSSRSAEVTDVATDAEQNVASDSNFEAGQAGVEAEPNPAREANPDGKISTNIGSLFTLANLILLSLAPDSVWFVGALVSGIYAAYLFFIDKRNLVTVSESGEAVVGFVVSPSFLESQSTDIPLEDLNRLPMIFRVLKQK